MRAKDVMTTEVATVAADTTFRDIVELMEGRGVSAVPVVGTDGELMGIVSEADLMLRAAGGPSRSSSVAYLIHPPPEQLRRKVEGLTAADVMTSDVVSAPEDLEIRDLARLMEWNRIKRIPITREGRLVGIVSRADVLKVFLRDDGDILNEITRDTLPRCVDDPSKVRVEVRRGVVTLSGELGADVDRAALRRHLEAVAGIVAVEDRTAGSPES